MRELNKALQRQGFRSSEIHGDMEQSQRIAELDRFKAGDVNILVASDVAARGLDIKGVSHVFNFDAPWHPDDYVHRIGRTGRAGATGVAFTLATSEDAENIANIEKLTGLKIDRYEGAADEEPAARSAARAQAGGEESRSRAGAKRPHARRANPAQSAGARERACRAKSARRANRRAERPARDARPPRPERAPRAPRDDRTTAPTMAAGTARCPASSARRSRTD